MGRVHIMVRIVLMKVGISMVKRHNGLEVRCHREIGIRTGAIWTRSGTRARARAGFWSVIIARERVIQVTSVLARLTPIPKDPHVVTVAAKVMARKIVLAKVEGSTCHPSSA